jgi:hypothetical protein
MDLKHVTAASQDRRTALRLDPEQLVRLAVECRSKWDFAHANGTDPTGTAIAQGVRVILLAPAASIGAGG